MTAIVGCLKLCDTTLLTIKLSLAKRNVGIIMTVIIIIAIAVGIVIYVLWSKKKKGSFTPGSKQQSGDIGISNPVYGYTEHQTVDTQHYDVAEFEVRTVCLSDQLLACVLTKLCSLLVLSCH